MRKSCRREAERTKVELNQQLALVQSMMLKVSNEREAFKKERLSVSEQANDSVRVRRNEGFKKQVEIYDGLAPKVALEHLLALEDSDQAAKILMELDRARPKRSSKRHAV